MQHVKTILVVFVLLLIGCTTAQDEGNSVEMPASQPGTAQPETTDSWSEASTASRLDMGVAAVEIATGRTIRAICCPDDFCDSEFYRSGGNCYKWLTDIAKTNGPCGLLVPCYQFGPSDVWAVNRAGSDR